MRPVQIGPCSRCGRTLEHDQDPLTVLCGGCERLRRCAICGEGIDGSGDSADYAFCPACRAELRTMGCTTRHHLNRQAHKITQHGIDCRCAGDRCRLGAPIATKPAPPPTVDFSSGQEIKGPPAWLVSGVLFGSIGFIVGFLIRGAL